MDVHKWLISHYEGPFLVLKCMSKVNNKLAPIGVQASLGIPCEYALSLQKDQDHLIRGESQLALLRLNP